MPSRQMAAKYAKDAYAIKENTQALLDFAVIGITSRYSSYYQVPWYTLHTLGTTAYHTPVEKYFEVQRTRQDAMIGVGYHY